MNIKQELINMIPKNMRLPLNGFTNPNYHVLAWYPDAVDFFMKLSLIDKALIVRSLYTNAKYNLAYVTRSLYLSKFGRHLCSLQFYGVQPLRFKGLTQYTDKNIDSFNSSLHYVLTPSEYIIWNKPVRAVADGEIINLVDTFQDSVKSEKNDYLNFNAYTYEFTKHIGNYMSIRHENGVISTYGSLRFHSMVRRIGDKVKKGDIIARVGCSGYSREPYLPFSLSIVDDGGLGHGLINTFIPLPALQFEPFYCAKIIEQYDNRLDSISELYPKDIVYKPATNGFIYNLSLVKNMMNVAVE